MPPFVYVQSQKIVDSVIASLEKEAKDVLESCKNQSKKYNMEPEMVLIKGSYTASIIVDYGEKDNFDVIVVGGIGHGKFKTALLGRVSHNVLHTSKGPVLIIK